MPIVENSKVNSNTCKLFRKKLSSFAKMQQHMTVDHMQKGDISTQHHCCGMQYTTVCSMSCGQTIGLFIKSREG